ncbi:pseudouridine synthase [Acephala macrosclerotiorum]|nr:pseudouridine synthase [Acephala macrosclerotiorum]
MASNMEYRSPPRDPKAYIAESITLHEPRELAVGITQYVDTNTPGFAGTLKQRYNDFHVNEIGGDGDVYRLADDRAPDCLGAPEREVINTHIKAVDRIDPVARAALEGESTTVVSDETTGPSAFVLSPEDEQFLVEHFGVEGKDKLITLRESIITHPNLKRMQHGFVTSPPIQDKTVRGNIHGQLRRIFSSLFDSSTDNNNGIVVIAAPSTSQKNPRGGSQPHRQQNTGQIKGKQGWEEKGGEHLHMTMCKENKDTMEVISYMARELRCKPKDFSFAGTKDRRATTNQRVSVFRQTAERVAKLNASLRNAAVGDFKYEKQRLELGELLGNLFVIVLRDCDFGQTAGMDDAAILELANNTLKQSLKSLKENGFINYFGLQRFGTHGIGTDIVGLRILQGNFKGAVDAILSYDAKLARMSSTQCYQNGTNRDDAVRASALAEFERTRSSKALETMPRKFSAETAIIRHLGSANKKTDYLGALGCIQRNLKTMYVHAYQSMVWNNVASTRWVRYGSKVIKGDLVLINAQDEKVAQLDEFDENGEVVIHPGAHDSAVNADDIFQRARALTAEEAESGKYTIFDVVLPTPGFDVNYPDNDIGEFYKEFMLSERGGGIDPSDMRRPQKDFSLSGSYRPFLATVMGEIHYETRIYYGTHTQLVETDLDKLKRSRNYTQQNVGDGAQSAAPSAGTAQAATGPQVVKNENAKFTRPASTSNSAASNSLALKSRAHHQTSPTKQIYVGRDVAAAREKYGNSNQMSAWLDFDKKLAVQDRESAAAADAFRAKMVAEDLEDPEIRDTWKPTIGESTRQRTGIKSVEVLGEKELETTETIVKEEKSEAAAQPGTSSPKVIGATTETIVEEKAEALAPAAVSSPKVGASVTGAQATSPTVKPASPIIKAAVSAPTTPEQGNKRAAAEISTSRASSPQRTPPLGCYGEPEPTRLATILTFSLGSSQYATMALRELMKAGGVRSYNPGYTQGR